MKREKAVCKFLNRLAMNIMCIIVWDSSETQDCSLTLYNYFSCLVNVILLRYIDRYRYNS